MTQTNIKGWIKYWAAAKMVSFSEIQSISDMGTARKFCECMRIGVFGDVSDKALWHALKSIRQELPAASSAG